jgi:hypothetical protein
MGWKRCGAWWIVAVGVAALATTGCGSRGLVPVKGVVRLDGKPVPEAVVNFHPVEVTKGNGGFGLADASGSFSAKIRQGLWGLYPGSYKVTLSRRPLPAGTPENPKTPQECEAWERAYQAAPETFPTSYTDPATTPLSATIDGRQGTLELSVTSQDAAAGRAP